MILCRDFYARYRINCGTVGWVCLSHARIETIEWFAGARIDRYLMEIYDMYRFDLDFESSRDRPPAMGKASSCAMTLFI